MCQFSYMTTIIAVCDDGSPCVRLISYTAMERKDSNQLKPKDWAITIAIILIACWLGLLIPYLVGDQDGRLETEDAAVTITADD